MKVGVYAGSFDPITYGHLSVITRAAAIFDKLIVLVAIHPRKEPTFSPQERVRLIQASLPKELDNVEVDATRGYVVHYARAHHAKHLVRGVRGATDALEETKLAHLNLQLAPEVDTIFVPAAPGLSSLSSSELKARAQRGEDIAGFCTPTVARALLARVTQSSLATQENPDV